ncbi:EbsA family protein [Microbacterium sp. NIBRBAC000506063]|uniref:EbsA family protein n=1 Tax=Microbacterium sp. NIBRBAC000506063 TaxID=2734618 RepID=UPI001BB72B5F|nr:EbsA family protein [Microbacterium sp. NIBRBAC000506063]QTV79896.1 hypothetical protein KAE78_01410 [Microbacterium sp. NIBRBAC000506063]
MGIQRGLDDAADAASITPWALGGLALLVGVTVLGWFLQPKAAGVPRETAVDAIPLALRDGERAVWVGTAAMARSGMIVLGVSLFVLALATVFSFAAGGEAGWITAIVLILVAVLVATMLVFRVRITADGLLVRSAVGWPRTRIPAGRSPPSVPPRSTPSRSSADGAGATLSTVVAVSCSARARRWRSRAGTARCSSSPSMTPPPRHPSSPPP